MELYHYKYIPKNVVLTLDQDYYFRDGSVTYINIVHDYHRRRLPVIQMGLEMDVEMVAKAYQYKETAKLKIDIDEQQIRASDDKVVNTTSYLQHTFSIVPAMDITIYIRTTDPETLEEMDTLKKLQNFEMYLIDMDAVNWFTKEIALILEKLTPTQPVTHAAALQSVFLERNIPGSLVVASPPTQNEELEKVVAPLQDLIHNIYHINTTYGLYDGVPIIYYDLEYLYCISKRQPNVKIPSAVDYGTVVCVLLDPSDAASRISGSNDDADNEIHWINLNKAPEIYDTRTKDTSAKFSTLINVNGEGKVGKTTLDGEATTVKYIYGTSELTEKQYLNETLIGHTVGIMTLDISVKFLKPHKDYFFKVGKTWENLKLHGHVYRIMNWGINIHREGVDNYVSDVTLTMYNPSRDDAEQEVVQG